MAWEDASTLLERFESVGHLLAHALPRRRRPGRTYQGLAKAMLRHGVTLVDELKDHLRDQSLRRCGRFRLRRGLEALAVDGSRFDAPRTVSNEAALGTAGKAGTHPQLSVTTVWHMGHGLPYDWRVGRADESERTHLRGMIGTLPPGCLLVVDAGFTGYDLIKQVLGSGRHVLVRVGAHVTLLTHGRPDERVLSRGGRVWLARGDEPPLTLRLVTLGAGERRVHLVTDLTDPRDLSKAAAGELYAMRWGVEVFYRHAKATLARRKVRSACGTRAVLEVHWTLIGLWLLMLLTASALVERGIDPLRAGVAAAARTARRWCRRVDARGPASRVLADLKRCIKDDAPRRAGKAGYRWPHKKKDPRPGPPRLRAATPTQRAAARAHRPQRHAA